MAQPAQHMPAENTNVKVTQVPAGLDCPCWEGVQGRCMPNCRLRDALAERQAMKTRVDRTLANARLVVMHARINDAKKCVSAQIKTPPVTADAVGPAPIAKVEIDTMQPQATRGRIPIDHVRLLLSNFDQFLTAIEMGVVVVVSETADAVGPDS